jgi:cytoskeletal protein RodZ
VPGTSATPATAGTPRTAASKHTSAAASSESSSPKTSAHAAASHKTTHKSAATKTSATKTSPHKSSPHKASRHGTASSEAKTSRTKVAARGKKSAKNSRTPKKRGQQAIDSGRATQIQEALIRQHYLQGEPTGTWDAATQAAMRKYQADQGWQSKTTPDSRALIKLGLGPSNDHLLNPESAMTSSPAPADPKSTTKTDPAQDPPQQ